MNRYLVGIAAAMSLSLLGCGGSKDAGNAGDSGATGASTSGGGSGGSSSGGPGAQAATGWRAKYPGTATLMSAVFGLNTLIQSGKTPLTMSQASHLSALLRPLPTLPKLSQDDAQKLGKAVDAQLTPDQQEAIGALRKQRRAAGKGRWAGGGGAGRQGGGQGGGPNGGAPGAGGPAGGGPGGPGGPGSGGGAGGRNGTPPWIKPDMAPDTNVFQTEPLKGRLAETLKGLDAAAKG